jgi:hypothetical protein
LEYARCRPPWTAELSEFSPKGNKLVAASFPEWVTDFEAFLKQAGLVCQDRGESPATRFKVVRWGNANLMVRVGFFWQDYRDVELSWRVEIADPATPPVQWYDAAILRQLLIHEPEDRLSALESVDFVETNWPAIVRCFSPEERDNTHEQLSRLREDYARRFWQSLYPYMRQAAARRSRPLWLLLGVIVVLFILVLVFAMTEN